MSIPQVDCLPDRGNLSFDFAARHLDEDQVDLIERRLGGREPFRCWAMTENSRPYWEAMKPGDIALFTRKGTGRFNFVARVATTIESQRLGEELWSVVPREPWSLIYVLEDVNRISMDKTELVTSLGYSRNYVVPGTIRVDPDRLQTAIERYGSVDELVTALDTP